MHGEPTGFVAYLLGWTTIWAAAILVVGCVCRLINHRYSRSIGRHLGILCTGMSGVTMLFAIMLEVSDKAFGYAFLFALVGMIPLGICWATMRINSPPEIPVHICTKCGYDLRACTENRCSECGHTFESRNRL